MIKHLILSSVMNVNFVFIGRLMQGASTTKINTEKINTIEERPCLYCSFPVLRTFFLTLILYNSILIADSFELVPVVMYIIYWLPVVFWFDAFYNLHFNQAILCSSFSSKFATILAVFLEPHPLLWTPACLFSAYCLYLSLWFKYCVPR